MIAPERVVFVDETGTNLRYTPTDARAPRGERAVGSAPANCGENRTIVAALTLDGIGLRLRFDDPITTDSFRLYVRHCLVPTLKPDQVVIADNLRAHLHPTLREAIEACGARFLSLSAYSPDFNPIEEGFSNVKQSLRRAKPRSDDDPHTATWAAFNSITPDDAAGWFTRCGGYPPSHQSC